MTFYPLIIYKKWFHFFIGMFFLSIPLPLRTFRTVLISSAKWLLFVTGSQAQTHVIAIYDLVRAIIETPIDRAYFLAGFRFDLISAKKWFQKVDRWKFMSGFDIKQVQR